jgi:competence protein ComEC
MNRLSVTMIDVGWGDSLLIEFEEDGDIKYGLVDSNDTATLRSSYIFLKRLFERRKITLPEDRPVFEFVLLSHPHADHAQGLKALMREFGAKNFWYPKSGRLGSSADLLRYANRYRHLIQVHQHVDDDRILPQINGASLDVLWPGVDVISDNENNNSVVLALTLGGVSFVLTGDAEEEVWEHAAAKIPAGTRFFKVPHHGSVNGTFGPGGSTPWFDACPDQAVLGISSHIRPHTHPDQEVLDLLDAHNRTYFRTDEHYHLKFTTDGHDVRVTYSH